MNQFAEPSTTSGPEVTPRQGNRRITRRQGLLGGAMTGTAGLVGTLVGRETAHAQADAGSTLFVATHGADDPNRATFPFLLARGTVRAGQPTQIMLIGDGTTLVIPGVLNGIVAAGPPPLREIYADLGPARPLLVCMGCARARGVTDEDVVAFEAQWIAGPGLDTLIAAAGRVVTF
jgi:predicted peroxiredoxin